MSLRQRAEQYTKLHEESNQRQAQNPGGRTYGEVQNISLFPNGPALGIVDNEVVEVQGLANVSGMSLVNICSTIGEGWQAPVPLTEVRLFRNITRDALQAMLAAEGQNSRQQRQQQQ